MSRLIYTTIYEDILSKIETATLKDIDLKRLKVGIIGFRIELSDKKYGNLIIMIRNEDFQKLVMEKYMAEKKPEEMTDNVKRTMCEQILYYGSIFSAQDIIIYRILLSHYINTQVNGYATITVDEIHNVYRGKAFMYKPGKEKYDKETLLAYHKSLNKLSNIEILIQFGESKRKSFKHYIYDGKYNFFHKMLILKDEKALKDILNNKIEYSLGEFGKYIMDSKQYGQVTPSELYKVRFNQIDTFNMGMYITRMIFLNRRGRTSLSIYVSTLLSRINKYDRKGITTSYTYLEYISSLKDSVKRNKKIKYINKQLDYILDLLVKEEKIKKYSYHGKFNYKFIRDEELYIKITFR